MKRPVWKLSDYQDLNAVYEGYASTVFKATCVHSGVTVALKVYEPSRLHPISQHQLMREARLHPTLDHPNIVKMYASFKYKGLVVMVVEWCDSGDLLALYYKNKSHIPEKTAASITRQLLKSLSYLHAKGIVHRDIKLENIVLNTEPATGMVSVKLADFGLAISLQEEPTAVTRAGTTDYMAPEVLRCPIKDTQAENKERTDIAYSQSADIWSLAVLAFEMVNGRPPFPRPGAGLGASHVVYIPDHHIQSLTSRPPLFRVQASGEMMAFVYSCLVPAESRLSADQLLASNPWVCKSSKATNASMSARSSSSDIINVPIGAETSQQLRHPDRMLTDTSLDTSDSAAAELEPPCSSGSLGSSLNGTDSVQRGNATAAASELSPAAAMLFDTRASAPVTLGKDCCSLLKSPALMLGAYSDAEDGAFSHRSLSQPGMPLLPCLPGSNVAVTGKPFVFQ